MRRKRLIAEGLQNKKIDRAYRLLAVSSATVLKAA